MISVSKSFITGGTLDRLWSPLEVLAVEDVSFQHPTGEVLVLQGGSGSGKSVTLNLLCGLYAPDEGKVRVFGKDPTRRNQPPHRTSLVRADTRDLDPGLSVRMNLDILAGFWGLDGEQRQRRISEALEFVDLPAIMDGIPLDEYPPGLRARVSLAAGMIPSPDLLLLDDPDRELDDEGKKQLRGLIRGLSQGDMTVVLATRGEGYAELGDQVLTMEDGVLVS